MRKSLVGLCMAALLSAGIGLCVGLLVVSAPQNVLAEDGCICVDEDPCFIELPSNCPPGQVKTYMCDYWEYCNGVPTYQCCPPCQQTQGCHYPT